MDRMVNEKSANNQITPEEAYECRETSMLLHELIDELPEEQRQCILLYYMEEYSIKDIAGVCKCSENTIKSRLNYGKKKLEEKTIELQKKGYVLRGVTPVYLITWLLKTDMGYKLSFVYGGAATSAFSHTLFTKLVNAGIVTAVNSGLTNAVGAGMNNTVQSGMTNAVESGTTNMVNSGMTTAAGEAVTGGTATVAEGTAAVNSGTAVAGTAAKGVASTAVKGGIHTLAGKIITGALATVIAGGLVTAGVVTIINNNKTEDEVTTEATTAEITTEVTTTETTTELTTEVTTEEVTEEEDPDAYYEEVYSVVIEAYIKMINEWYPAYQSGDDFPSDYYEYEEAYPWVSYMYLTVLDFGISLDNTGYLIYDIDENGIPDLLIGNCDGNIVPALYTISEDEITCVWTSGARYCLYYNGDNSFGYMGYGGLGYEEYALYNLVSDKLELIEEVFSEPKDWDNRDDLLYYITTEQYTDEDNSSATEISESEFNAKKAEYIDENYTFTDLTPLSEY